VTDAQRALDVLLELTAKLTDERSLNRALKLVTEAALALLPGDHASIRVLDHTRTELLSGARSGSGVGKRPVKHEAGQGVAGWVVDQGEVVRIADARLDPRFVLKPNQGFEIRSMLAVPLWSAGEVVGVLAATGAETGIYASEDEQLCQLLANCAVPPIEKARLARLAVTDAHTMAFNQAYLIPGLQSEMAKLRGTPGTLSMLLMDLDYFKRINDRLGHAAGDRALREFANRVRATTRDADIVVRRGGDEFVLIMPGAGRDSAMAVAERIRATMEKEAMDLGSAGTFSTTVSIGVATWDGKETPEQLEARADEAMYEVKLEGRDGVLFREPLDDDVPETRRDRQRTPAPAVAPNVESDETKENS
jgi:diguanylate cyclase (GGDEF)-like protein